MKPTDLMIGDWYYWEAEGKKYPLQVTKETFVLSDEDIANFEPIPISSEILKGNGWIGCTSCINCYNCRDAFCLKLVADGFIMRRGTCINTISGIIGGEVISAKPIKYVHELQHALKLYSSEKEITLYGILLSL